MIDQGDREIDFICPYTKQRMTSPLMKYDLILFSCFCSDIYVVQHVNITCLVLAMRQ